MRILEPTLIVDETIAKNNIRRMVDRSRASGATLRPHFKTHQSLEVGKWFKSLGVTQIACSSFRMASYFSADWDDILVAFPCNILEIDRINDLASRIQLHLTVFDVETIHFLEQHLHHAVNVWIKIDAGNNRAGLLPDDEQNITHLIEIIQRSTKMHCQGFLLHAGQTYKARAVEEIEAIFQLAQADILYLKSRYSPILQNLRISFGDTPSCSVINHIEEASEWRPGNFVYYDLTQYKIGSCSLKDIAVALVCPVVGKVANRLELILYGGGVHLSKDRLELPDGRVVWGLAVRWNGDSWSFFDKEYYLRSISQEHGVLPLDKEMFNTIQVGDLIGILPIHSCMSADLQKSVHTFDGKKYSMLRPND